MVNQPLIRTKLLRIENNLKRIDEFKKLTITAFKKDLNAQDIVLYNLQLAVQGCLDIASHIISDQGWNTPASLLIYQPWHDSVMSSFMNMMLLT